MELPDKVSSMKELSRRLQSRRPRLEPILNKLFCKHNTMVTDDIAVNTLVLSAGGQSHKQDSSSTADENDDSGNGKSKASKAVVDSGRPSGSGDNTESKGKGNGKGKGKN